MSDEDEVWEKGLYEIEDGEYLDPDHPKFNAEVVNGGKTSDKEKEEVKAPIFNASGPCVTAMPAQAKLGGGLGPVPVNKQSSLIVMIRHGKTENNKLGLFTGWEDGRWFPH